MTSYTEAAKKWLSDSFDEETKKEVRALIDGDPALLKDAF